MLSSLFLCSTQSNKVEVATNLRKIIGECRYLKNNLYICLKLLLF